MQRKGSSHKRGGKATAGAASRRPGAPSRSRLSLFANLPIGIYRVSSECRLITANPRLAHMLGFDNFEEMAAHYEEVEPFEPVFAQRNLQEWIRKEGELRGIDGAMRRRDGSQIFVRESVRPVRGRDGRTGGYDVAIQDITARKTAEMNVNELQARLERFEKEERRERLIQGIAHEVRNPLFAIKVNLAVLRKHLATSPDTDILLDRITEHARRLEALMQSMIEVGRPVDSGEFKPCTLQDVIRAAREPLIQETEPGSGRLRLNLPAEPFTLDAAMPLLTKAIAQLMSNALENSPEDTVVTVSLHEDPEGWHVTIVDRGRGIPAEVMASLGDPFVTSRGGHLGLGLAMVHHYLDAHGATLSGYNNPDGQGATFDVTFLPPHPEIHGGAGRK